MVLDGLLSDHGYDEKGRRKVNAHGDLGVMRTPENSIPVQLPLSYGDVVEIDGKRERFVGYVNDGLRFVSEDREGEDGGMPDPRKVVHNSAVEGVHHFNTRVREAEEVKVESNETEWEEYAGHRDEEWSAEGEE